jgi:transposase-like protein
LLVMNLNLPIEKVLPLDPQNTFCPYDDCPNRGQTGRGNIGIKSQKERRYYCKTCRRTFAATTGTVYYRAHHPAWLVTAVLVLLAWGCPPQAIVAAFGFDERTVAAWALKAGGHCQQVHEHLVEAGQVTARVVQADELWVKLVGRKVWQAMAMVADSRLWLGGVISVTRDRHLITALVTRVHGCLHRYDITVCVDGLASYVTAFLRVFQRKVPPLMPRRGAWTKVVEAGLRIGQVVKRYTSKYVSAVEERGVRGSVPAIRHRVKQAGVGQHIHTAFIERLNATFRAHWAGLVRRGRALVRTEALATAGMWLVGCCYNWCWPHDSLRVATTEERRCHWLARTPAMVAGLTDHVWSMDELLSYKVPLPAWEPPKRPRGRPKGSKNKPKAVVAA